MVTPLTPVSRAWTWRFGLVWFGFWLAWLTPIQLLLPDQLDAIDQAHKVRDFALVNGGSGVLALVALPVFGAWCDRTSARFGRRRVWIVGGVMVMAAGLIASGAQTHAVGLGLTWLVVTLGNAMISAGLTAVVADRVPESQRGLISSAMWGPQAIGVVVGLVALTVIGGHGVLQWGLLAVVLVATATPFVLRQRDTSASAPGLRDMWRGWWIDPRRHPDFAWAFGGRLAVNLGNALGTTYLLYFLQDYLHVRDPESTLVELTVVYLVLTLLATYAGGIASDRTGRRRVFVVAAALLQAVAAALLALAPSLPVAFVAAGFLGAGYGAYMAVDQALVTAVLPDPDDRAKDLGIMNVGAAGPQALAPLLAGVIISGLGGYRVLFAVGGVAALAGAVMMRGVRSVR